MLEQKFIGTLSFVELAEENFPTYSIEYAHQFLAIGSELDTFFKVYCGFDLKKPRNIMDYTKYILDTYPEIKFQKINIADTEIHLCPYSSWEKFNATKPTDTLEWWKAYNKVKHNRSGYLKNASLENTLNALAALYLIEMKYLQIIAKENQKIDEPDESSKIFNLVDWKFNKTFIDSIMDNSYKSSL